nr:hypothetical protein OG513_03710 [Streptomyces sp. NBC_00998]
MLFDARRRHVIPEVVPEALPADLLDQHAEQDGARTQGGRQQGCRLATFPKAVSS